MAIIKVSVKVVPLTLALAVQFRDMKSLRGERELKTSRVKNLVKLLAEGKLATLHWGKHHFEGKAEEYRDNGQHTSWFTVACMQATVGELDERSRQFCEQHLFVRSGAWSGEGPEDLPRVQEKQITVVIEDAIVQTREDQIARYNRWDSRSSARNAGHLFGIHVGEHADFNGMEAKKVGFALAGVLRAAKLNHSAFGFEDDDDLTAFQGDDRGSALSVSGVRLAVRWIVETVPDETLYSKIPGAQVFAELHAEHGPEDAEKIVERLMEQLENDEEPAVSWEQALNKRRNRPTLESMVKKGRTTLRQIAADVLQEA